MEFIPFAEARKADRESVIAVDCFLPGALSLSHWRGANPPASVADDTSAAMVINALEKGIIPAEATNATNNHFDVDGFIGVWSLLNPALALKNALLLKAMALLGDFRELPEDSLLATEAIKLVTWLNTVEKKKFYAPFEEKHQEEKACVAKYRFFLKEFEEVLNEPDEDKASWEKEADRVQEDLLKLENNGQTRFYEDIRLLVANAPGPLHYYALFGRSAKADMVLTIYPNQQYELEYKYTTWVDAYGRKSFPRINFKPLLSKLNRRENSGYTWTGSDITDTGPVLRLGPRIKDKKILFDHPYNRPFYASTIKPEVMEKIIIDFYRAMYDNVEPKEIWSWEEIRRINHGV